MTQDYPIHIMPPKDSNHSPSIVLSEFCISQTTLDALNILIHWCDGFKDAGKGQVPGHFEMIMFHRSLSSAVHAAHQAKFEEEARAKRTDPETGECHHHCDECGVKGPILGKHERICFWLCDACSKKHNPSF